MHTQTETPELESPLESFQTESAPNISLPANARTLRNTNSALLGNVVWMLTGNVVFGLSQWAYLVLLAKLGNVELVGNFSLALAIVLPVLMLASFSLRSIQVTDAHHLFRFLEYGFVRVVAMLFSLVLILGIGLSLHQPGPLLSGMLLLGAAKGFEYTSDILYGVLQQREEMSAIAISMTLRGLLSLVGLGIALQFTRSLAVACFAIMLASLLVLAVYDIPKALRDRRTSFQSELINIRFYLAGLRNGTGRSRLLRLSALGLPMGLVLMLASLNLNIPRYLVQHQLGVQELGVFSAIATLLSAGSNFTNAIGQAASPRLAKYFAARDYRRFGRLLAGVIVITTGLGATGFLGALFFGRQGMALLFRPEYSTHQNLLLWLMTASGFVYLGSTLGYAVTAVRCLHPQLPLFVGSVVATASASMVLVPAFGVDGAGIAILISGVVQSFGGAWLLFRSRATQSVSVLA